MMLRRPLLLVSGRSEIKEAVRRKPHGSTLTRSAPGVSDRFTAYLVVKLFDACSNPPNDTLTT